MDWFLYDMDLGHERVWSDGAFLRKYLTAKLSELFLQKIP